MKMNQYNEIEVTENDLVEGMLQGKSAKYIVTKDTEKIDSYNHFCTLFKFDDQIDYETPADTNDKYSYKDANNWWMPEEYKTLDIEQYLLRLITTPQQRERVYAELEEFRQRDMLPMLNFLVYMITELKSNNIMWGVGRGSSVSSYILYLIGVHKIDSIKYNLDYKEFLR
jgi:DNA polymerase III alpha subunit